MAIQTINIGTAPNDNTGDTIRASFGKCNDNFTELYSNDNTAMVDTITELIAVDTSVYTTALVSDIDRGGVFKYNASLAATTNNGTIFAGWVRQYTSSVNLSWFGDTTLEATWVDATSVGVFVEIPVGTYSLASDLIDLSANKYHSFGTVTVNNHSTIDIINLHDLSPLASPTFTGTVTLPVIVMGSSLPTSDPSVSGQLWNDSGTIKVSV